MNGIEKRGLFEKIFGKTQENTEKIYEKTSFQLLNSYETTFFNYEGELYDSDVVRSCIHTIASHAAKLKPHHLSSDGTAIQSRISKLLAYRPNPHMNTYDFIYRTISQLYSTNNAYIYLQWFDGKLIGMYPINYSSAELKEYQGNMYLTFSFQTGKRVTIPYDELIHLRRHYNRHDLFGEEALQPLYSSLNVLDTANQGIISAIKNSARLRGFLKFNQNLRSEDIKKQKDEFMAEYLNTSNDGGIGALDSKADFIPLKMESVMADDKQTASAKDNVYRYFNISEKIITSNYTEDEYNAFYSSVIEPIAIQMSLEFTSKIFTEREKGFGNQIIFSAERLTFANNSTKAQLINTLLPLGVMSINEARTILELAPIEDGDRHLVSLNYVDLSKANEYQLGEEDLKGGESVDSKTDAINRNPNDGE